MNVHSRLAAARAAFDTPAPDGEKDGWRINTFTIKPDNSSARMFNLQALFNGNPEAMVDPGTYRRLVTPKGQIMMSSTQMERRTNWWIIHNAKGRVLINGLGLGCVLSSILTNPEVTEVWVVEKEKAVIDLVWPHFKDDRLKLIHADALEYRPPKGIRFDVVWHDIWPTVSEDNRKDMKRLHRRYGRICDMQASWSRDKIDTWRRQNRGRYW